MEVLRIFGSWDLEIHESSTLNSNPEVVGFYQQNVWKTPVESDILSNVTLPPVFFKHFAIKNQLPGSSVGPKWVEAKISNFISILRLLIKNMHYAYKKESKFVKIVFVSFFLLK